jgi:hypothetical protein
VALLGFLAIAGSARAEEVERISFRLSDTVRTRDGSELRAPSVSFEDGKPIAISLRVGDREVEVAAGGAARLDDARVVRLDSLGGPSPHRATLRIETRALRVVPVALDTAVTLDLGTAHQVAGGPRIWLQGQVQDSTRVWIDVGGDPKLLHVRGEGGARAGDWLVTLSDPLRVRVLRATTRAPLVLDRPIVARLDRTLRSADGLELEVLRLGRKGSGGSEECEVRLRKGSLAAETGMLVGDREAVRLRGEYTVRFVGALDVSGVPAVKLVVSGRSVEEAVSGQAVTLARGRTLRLPDGALLTYQGEGHKMLVEGGDLGFFVFEWKKGDEAHELRVMQSGRQPWAGRAGRFSLAVEKVGAAVRVTVGRARGEE